MSSNRPGSYHHSQYSHHTEAIYPGWDFVMVDTDLSLKVQDQVITTNANPSYQVEIAKGLDASQPYFRTGFEYIKPGNISYNAWIPPEPSWNYEKESWNDATWLGHRSTFDFPSDSDLDDQALGRLKSHLASNVGQFDALVPLAELTELRRTIVGAANSARAMLDLMAGIQKTKKEAFKHAAEAWLTWSFGISPTLNDIKDLSGSIQKYLDNGNYSLRVKGDAQKDWISRNYGTATGSFLSGNMVTQGQTVHNLSYRYIAGFHLNVKAGNNYGVSDHFGLELGKLPSVAWELVPFSWVIDYFSTVGAYLDDVFESPPGETIYVNKCRRYTQETQTHLSHVGSSNPAVIVKSSKEDWASYKWFGFERTVHASLPHRSFRLKSHDEIGTNAVNKLLNLAAVFISGHKS